MIMSLLVIPAEAGIQFLQDQVWIPVYTGMTGQYLPSNEWSYTPC
jgi:hypothetical protein